MTWPLGAHLSSALAHDAEDPLLSASILWWNAHVLPLTRHWLDGFFFHPAGGALALSDHRLGLMPLAAPLLWLGLGPVTTYNITLLATYPLSAIAAHGLAFTLTRRHDAAAVSGLAFGFNPFRVEHIPHLELLAAFGMPAALWALHLFVETPRPKWIVAFTAALTVQGLCSSYYLLFFLVLLALWVPWFVSWREWRIAAAIAAACVVCAITLSPIAAEYARVHRQFDLSRSFGEVLAYSADVTSMFTASPLIAAWGWTAPLNGNEARIFPGMTIIVLALAGTLSAWRGAWTSASSGGSPTASLVLVATAIVFAAVAAGTAVHGPWTLNLGSVVVAGTVMFKPLSVAAAALAGSIVVSRRARAACRRRSPLAFYVAGASVLFLCALGPKPRFLGHQILYEPPYAWLMRFPVFDNGVRVPARFAMPAALALSVAASLAFSRLSVRGSKQTAAALAIVVLGILADTWVPTMPLAPVPDMWNPVTAERFAAVLELPLGTGEDVSAMYRAVHHHRPTINGYSGYAPPHYDPLRVGLTGYDDTTLDAIASAGPLLVVVDKLKGDRWPEFVRAHRGAIPLGDDRHWAFFSLPHIAPSPRPCDMATLPIAEASDARGAVAAATITDGNRFTWWTPGHPQQVGDTLVLDLGRVAKPCAVALLQKGFPVYYPRTLAVAVSADGAVWTTAFLGKTGGLAVLGALASPANPPLEIALPSSAARFIRLRVEQALEHDPWVVTDVEVRGMVANQ